jgi:hypothetical protein
MTHHNDLLAKIKAYKWYAPVDYGQINLSNALCAVVELHKPIEISGEELCDACEEWTNEGANYRVYPCPTIQIIEKELE